VFNEIDCGENGEVCKMFGRVFKGAAVSLDPPPRGFLHGAPRNVNAERSRAPNACRTEYEIAGVAADIEVCLATQAGEVYGVGDLRECCPATSFDRIAPVASEFQIWMLEIFRVIMQRDLALGAWARQCG
jgi:hypothetical protein